MFELILIFLLLIYIFILEFKIKDENYKWYKNIMKRINKLEEDGESKRRD